MKIWAWDPGAVETGLAYGRLSKDGKLVALDSFQGPNLLNLWDLFIETRESEDIVLIEDFRGGGHLTQAAKLTIQTVGAIQFAVELDWAFGPGAFITRVEQQRLSGRRDAAVVLGATIETLEKDKGRKDAFSALSHVFAYWRTTYA